VDDAVRVDMQNAFRHFRQYLPYFVLSDHRHSRRGLNEQRTCPFQLRLLQLHFDQTLLPLADVVVDVAEITVLTAHVENAPLFPCLTKHQHWALVHCLALSQFKDLPHFIQLCLSVDRAAELFFGYLDGDDLLRLVVETFVNESESTLSDFFYLLVLHPVLALRVSFDNKLILPESQQK
jgi:hypothetical protein